MRYSLLGYVIGTVAALYSVQLGDPQFFTQKHLETVADSMASSGFLSRHHKEQEEPVRGAHCAGGWCQDKGTAD